MDNKDDKKIKRSGLGRGLSALLSDSQTESMGSENTELNPEISPATIGSISHIPVENIESNPYQPRHYFDEESLKELAESINVHGLVQPITVRKLGHDKFQLISGERRLKAAKLAGISNIPSYIRIANDQAMLELALIENLHRDDLNAVEIALSFKRLVDECKITLEDLGERVGKDRSTVNNYLRLLKLPPEIQIGLRDKVLTMGHARALINLENIDIQLYAYNECINKDLSVRQIEKLVQQIHSNKIKPKSGKYKKELNSELKSIQTHLSTHFGTKINIETNNKGKGAIRIPFYSNEDLNRILEVLRVS